MTGQRNIAKEEDTLHKAMTIAGNFEWKRAKILGLKQFSGGTGNEQRLQQWRAELEKVDVTENLRKELWFICREEVPNQLGEETTHARWLTAALVEYFRLKILNPRESEEGLLRLFRQSAREGRVVLERFSTDIRDRPRFLRCSALLHRDVYRGPLPPLQYDLWLVPKV